LRTTYIVDVYDQFRVDWCGDNQSTSIEYY
jgi:hypothetical protein